MLDTTKLTIDDLNKSNIWTINEVELYRMLKEAQSQDDYAEFESHYKNIIRPVFDMATVNIDDSSKIKMYEAQGYQIFHSSNEADNTATAIRRRPIKKVTDLTLENIRHLEPYEVLSLIEHNMGTGWKGLPLAIQDIIESAFFVDCSVLPAATLHKAGGILEKRTADGYEVLELVRGMWTEAIFIKQKPKSEKNHQGFDDLLRKTSKRGKSDDEDEEFPEIEEEEDDEEMEEIPDIENEEEEEEDIFDDMPEDIEDIEVIEEEEEEED